MPDKPQCRRPAWAGLTNLIMLGMATLDFAQTLQLIDPAERNLGMVERNILLTHRFRLENTGRQSLRLKIEKRSCGSCTSVSLNREILVPGDKVECTVYAKSGQLVGPQTLRVLLGAYPIAEPRGGQSNPPVGNVPLIPLTLRWQNRDDRVCVPEAIRFGVKNYPDMLEKSITFDLQKLAQGETIEKIECDSPHIRCGRIEKFDNIGRMRTSIWILPGAPVGVFRAEIRVKTSNPDSRGLRVPVEGVVLGLFQPSRSLIHFGLVNGRAEKKVEIQISGPKDGKTQVEKILFDPAVVQCALKNEGPGKYTLVTSLLPRQAEGIVRTTVTLCTSAPAQPRLALPVMAVIKPSAPQAVK